jgi:hypothetical protein
MSIGRTSPPPSDLERAEPAKLDSLSATEREFHARENGVDHELSTLHGHLRLSSTNSALVMLAASVSALGCDRFLDDIDYEKCDHGRARIASGLRQREPRRQPYCRQQLRLQGRCHEVIEASLGHCDSASTEGYFPVMPSGLACSNSLQSRGGPRGPVDTPENPRDDGESGCDPLPFVAEVKQRE